MGSKDSKINAYVLCWWDIRLNFCWCKRISLPKLYEYKHSLYMVQKFHYFQGFGSYLRLASEQPANYFAFQIYEDPLSRDSNRSCIFKVYSPKDQIEVSLSKQDILDMIRSVHQFLPIQSIKSLLHNKCFQKSFRSIWLPLAIKMSFKVVGKHRRVPALLFRSDDVSD